MAEVLVLAAALDVSPIELIFPVGFDKETEMLPGLAADPLAAMRWFEGDQVLDVHDGVVVLRRPDKEEEQSSPYLVILHDDLIRHLGEQEANTDRAIAEAAAEGADDGARNTASHRMTRLAELRGFIREPLRRLRAEMRERGMILPDLPPDIGLEEEQEPASIDPDGDA